MLAAFETGWFRTPKLLLLLVGLSFAVLAACDVPEHIDLVADPASGDTVSIVALATVPPTHQDVVYRTCDSCEGSKLDVYAPDDPSAGTIVFFHGGGFDGGAKELIILMGLIKSQTERGWTVITPNYHLAAPGDPASRDAVLKDARAALAWAGSSQAGALGVPTGGPLIVAGHSAGGTLAGLLATTDTSGAIDGWVSISGILSWDIGPNSAAAADTLHGGSNHEASPVDLFAQGTPPGYLIHGDRDDVIEWLNLLAAGLASTTAGGPALTFDLVDVNAQAAGMGQARGHLPVGGANATRFNAWLDSFE